MAVKSKKVLDIYIDEGGDLGIKKSCSNLYLVSMVLYDNSSINGKIKYLEENLEKIKFKGIIHTSPLVNNREEYIHYSLDSKRKIFWTLFYFAKSINVKLESIVINKRFVNNQKQLLEKLEIDLLNFIDMNMSYFNLFDEIIVYYDKGQELLMKIIKKSFESLGKVKIVVKFEYDRLFQIADLLTFVDKLNYKIINKMRLTNSEKNFFTYNDLKKIKNYKKNHSK